MKILISSHFLIDPIVNAASSTSLQKLLVSKNIQVTQIEYPFANSRDKYAYVVSSQKKGKFIKKYKVVRNPEWLSYIAHPIFFSFIFLKSINRYELGIAFENLSFLVMFFLKKLGFIKSLIYYSVDYVPRRFENNFLNFIYHSLDRFAVYNSDANWVVAKEQVKARNKNGIDLKKSAPFEIVPIGFRSKDIKIRPISKIDFYSLMFCGTLRESAGPEIIVKALPKIAEKFPKIRLTLIGKGDKKPLLQLAKELKVLHKVKFLQNLDNHNKLTKILTKGSIGLAPYAPVANSISYNSDPGKIKLYLLCGLPVITTSIATSHKLISQANAGRVVQYKEDKFAEEVIFMLSDKRRYAEMKSSAIELGKNFDSDKNFFNALQDYI